MKIPVNYIINKSNYIRSPVSFGEHVKIGFFTVSILE